MSTMTPQLPDPFVIDDHVQFDHYRDEWHDKTSHLYHAPRHLLEALNNGDISEHDIGFHTDTLFRNVRHLMEQLPNQKLRDSDIRTLMPLFKEPNYNPNSQVVKNSIGLLEYEDFLYHLIKSQGNDLVLHALENGWDHTALEGHENGLPGLFGLAGECCNNASLHALKAYSDMRGGCLDIHSPAHAIDPENRNNEDRSRIIDWSTGVIVNEEQISNSLFDAVLSKSERFDNTLSLLNWGVDPYALAEIPEREPVTLADIMMAERPDDRNNYDRKTDEQKAVLSILMRKLTTMGTFRMDYDGDMSSEAPPDYIKLYSLDNRDIGIIEGIDREEIEDEIIYKEDEAGMHSKYVLIKHAMDVEERLYKPLKQLTDDPSSHAFDLDKLTAKDIIKLYSITRLDVLFTPALWHGREAQLTSLINSVPQHVQEAACEYASMITAMNARTTVQGPAKDWSALETAAPESEVQR